MFAGDGPAPADGFIENLFEGLLHAVHFLLVPFVGQESGMEIAVAHVAEGADAQLVFPGHRRDKTDHGRQLAARHGGVLQDGRGRDARQGGKSAAAGASQSSGSPILAKSSTQ